MTPKLKQKIQAYIKDVQMLEDGNTDLALKFFTDANNLLYEIKEEIEKTESDNELDYLLTQDDIDFMCKYGVGY